MRAPRHSEAYWAAMAAWLNAPTETPAEAICRAIREAQKSAKQGK